MSHRRRRNPKHLGLWIAGGAAALVALFVLSGKAAAVNLQPATL